MRVVIGSSQRLRKELKRYKKKRRKTTDLEEVDDM